ncbi:MAG: cupin domain-containing protein [bacterium]|nr:cupin domain-containing protein [bacterium]
MATRATKGMERKSFSSPDERRPFDKGSLEVVNVGGSTIGRGTFQPGFKWSECVKPIAKTHSCEARHLGYMVSGRMKIVMDDGSEMEVAPGEAAFIPAGHDAWVVGKEPCVFIDFSGFAEYAKKA